MSQRSPSRRQSGGWRSVGYTRRRRSSERSRERSRERDHYERRGRSRSRSSSGGEDEGNRLHVADLHVDTTKRELENAFRKFGPLVEVWLARSPQCFAFIVFHRKEDANEAIRTMNGKKLDGSRIRVTKARPRTRGSGRRRGYNPNLRCYLCGRQGHFSRDCRKNDGRHGPRPSSKDRAIVIPVDDINSWDITDEDIIRYNQSPTPSRSHSRSRSSSSSRSGRRRRKSSSGSRSRSRSHSRSSSRSSRDRSRGRKKKSRRKSKSRSPSRNKKSEEKVTNPSPEKKNENGKDSEKKGSALAGLDYDSSSPQRSPDRGETAAKAGDSASTARPGTSTVNSSQPTAPAMSGQNGNTINSPPTAPLPSTTTVQAEVNNLNTSASASELA